MFLNPSKLLLTTVLACTTPAWAALTVNADGTVTDTTTGLVWDRCVKGLSGPTCAGGAAMLTDWPSALTTATTANAASYKGFTDWRLPNVNELESIVKLDAHDPVNPVIDSAAFPNTPITGDATDYGGGTWTSTSIAAFGFTYPVIVLFRNGNISGSTENGPMFIRLVRSGQSLAAFDLLDAPSAKALVITGTAQLGQVLTGAYVYADDVGGDAEDTSGSGSSYRFVRSIDSDVSTLGDNTDVASGVTGGVNKTYAVQASDVGQYLFYCVTPKALTGASPGLEACSGPTAAIAGLPQAITGFAPTSPVVLGAAPVTLTATGGASGNPVVLATSSASTICTVSGAQLTYVGVGVCNLTANQAAGGNYSAAAQVTASVTINAPPPVGAVTAIPTLSEWSMILLSGLLALFGVVRVRRQTQAHR